MDNLIVIGKGMVGNATMHILGMKDFISVKDSTMSYKEARSRKKFFFICVPTPTVKGRCDISEIENVIQACLSQEGEQPIFVIRSTVYPGACKYLMDKFGIRSIVHWPEFLTESTWKQDIENPDVIVLGGEQNNYLEAVESVLRSKYRVQEIVKTDTITSEMVKYAINCFYALKVVYANELYEVCKKNGANYNTIKNLMYQRKWIGKNHLDVWFRHGLEEQPQRGVTGKCLPKDLEAFSEYSQSKLLLLAKHLNDGYVGRSD